MFGWLHHNLRLKSTFFWKKNSNGVVVKKILKHVDFTLFEVIMQPPKHTFEIGFFFHILAHCGVCVCLYVDK